MASVAEDDVEKNDRRRRVLRGGRDSLVAEPEIDHRVRSADRELVVAEVQERVDATGLRIRERFLQENGGLVRERAATVEPADRALTRRQTRRMGEDGLDESTLVLRDDAGRGRAP